MKKITKQVLIATIIASVFSACGPTADDILKKYGTYSDAGTNANKAGVSIKMQPTGDILITCANSLLNANENNMQIVSERWFVADAENPGVKLPVEKEITVTDEHNIILKVEHIKERFLIIGFEGIAPIESNEVETQPLFFLVENKEAESKILTTIPKLAGELFTANYKPAFFAEQDYSGEIPFEKSKNVVLYLTLSADLQKVTKLKLTIGELNLTPANFDKQRKVSEGKSIFNYLENSNLRTNFAIKTINGYNVPSDDISNVQFIGGGFETTSPIDIIDGKITLNKRPIICDLTVTNACVYGTVKVEMYDCGTQSIYAVFKNTTTPQNIPENILNK